MLLKGLVFMDEKRWKERDGANTRAGERLLRAVMRMEKPPGTEPGQWMALLSRVITGPTGVRGGAMVKAVMEHATRGVRP